MVDASATGGGTAFSAAMDSVALTVLPVNDATVLTGPATTVTFAENAVNATPRVLFGDVALSDPEGHAGGVLRVSGLLAEDRVSVLDGGAAAGTIGLSGAEVTYGGDVIGTISGGIGAELRIDLGAGATVAAVEALIESLGYANASDAPAPERALRLHLADASGVVLSPPQFAELTGADNPFAGLVVGGYTASAFADLDGDGDLDLVLGSSATTLRAIAQDPGGLGITVAVTAENDVPIARNDAFATAEDAAISGRVLDDNGAGADGDPDQDALIVVGVNGEAALVGAVISLASGAVLTMRQDGTFDYDPTGALDSFAYAVSDGTLSSTAGVQITVNDAPVLTSPAAFTVAPGVVVVGVIAATDAEGDALTYAIVGGADADRFAINPTTGALPSWRLPRAARMT